MSPVFQMISTRSEPPTPAPARTETLVGAGAVAQRAGRVVVADRKMKSSAVIDARVRARDVDHDAVDPLGVAGDVGKRGRAGSCPAGRPSCRWRSPCRPSELMASVVAVVADRRRRARLVVEQVATDDVAGGREDLHGAGGAPRRWPAYRWPEVGQADRAHARTARGVVVLDDPQHGLVVGDRIGAREGQHVARRVVADRDAPRGSGREDVAGMDAGDRDGQRRQVGRLAVDDRGQRRAFAVDRAGVVPERGVTGSGRGRR